MNSETNKTIGEGLSTLFNFNVRSNVRQMQKKSGDGAKKPIAGHNCSKDFWWKKMFIGTTKRKIHF